MPTQSVLPKRTKKSTPKKSSKVAKIPERVASDLYRMLLDRRAAVARAADLARQKREQANALGATMMELDEIIVSSDGKGIGAKETRRLKKLHREEKRLQLKIDELAESITNLRKSAAKYLEEQDELLEDAVTGQLLL